ncbi:MAG: hypothetical protein R3E48_19825 [Burkholderiaceae bacterium]
MSCACSTVKENYALAIREMFDPALGGESRLRDALRTRAEPFLWPAQERVLLDLYLSVSKRAEAIVAATERAGSDARSALAAPGASTGAVHVAGSAPGQAAQRPERALRVFHGLYNIAGIPSIMARAERAIGLESKAVCFPAGGFGYEPDIVEQPAWSAAEIRARFRRYASEYDVFVFHFGHSMANETLADIPLLKRMGESRSTSMAATSARARKRFESTGIAPARSAGRSAAMSTETMRWRSHSSTPTPSGSAR